MMTNQEVRLQCLIMAVDTIKATREYIEPFERAEQFYEFVSKEVKPARKKPGPRPKKK